MHLAAQGLDWTSPATAISDTLLQAGWDEGQVEYAMRWLA
jgi:hypothetical protein